MHASITNNNEGVQRRHQGHGRRQQHQKDVENDEVLWHIAYDDGDEEDYSVENLLLTIQPADTTNAPHGGGKRQRSPTANDDATLLPRCC